MEWKSALLALAPWAGLQQLRTINPFFIRRAQVCQEAHRATNATIPVGMFNLVNSLIVTMNLMKKIKFF